MILWTIHYGWNKTHNLVNQTLWPDSNPRPCEPNIMAQIQTHKLVNQTLWPRFKPMTSWTKHYGPDSNPRPCEPDIMARIQNHGLVNQTLSSGLKPTILWNQSNGFTTCQKDFIRLVHSKLTEYLNGNILQAWNYWTQNRISQTDFSANEFILRYNDVKCTDLPCICLFCMFHHQNGYTPFWCLLHIVYMLG